MVAPTLLLTVLQPFQSSLKITTALFGMLQLTCGTSFLLLLCSFSLFSVVHLRHLALLHFQALILDPLLTFVMAFYTHVLRPHFLRFCPSITIQPLLKLISWNLTTRCLAVNGGGSTGSRAHCNIIILTYL